MITRSPSVTTGRRQSFGSFASNSTASASLIFSMSSPSSLYFVERKEIKSLAPPGSLAAKALISSTLAFSLK